MTRPSLHGRLSSSVRSKIVRDATLPANLFAELVELARNSTGWLAYGSTAVIAGTQ
jgi:hypothetical protein